MKPDPYPTEGAPRFPTSMLPPRLEAIVKAIAEAYHVPDVMPAAIALAIVSAAIGISVHFDSNMPHWNLWHCGIERANYKIRDNGNDRVR